MNATPRRSGMVSLEEAVTHAPTLASLQQRIQESSRHLTMIQQLIPAPLRRHVKAGPLQDDDWCLLVGNATAASKLRQLVPAIQQELNQKGAKITSIRIKIQAASR